MEYSRLGNSTLQVSRICLDFGNCGADEGLLSQGETDQVVQRAVELGVNFFETANYYHHGSSQAYLGTALERYAEREKVRIALKLFDEKEGLSRRAIFRGLEESLRKLHTDYIDLVILPKWGAKTPIAETMEALYDIVRVGRVKQLGACDLYAYQFMKAQETARIRHWRRFVSMQSQYHVLYREDERELLKMLQEAKVSFMPYLGAAAEKICLFRQCGFSEDAARAEQEKDADHSILLRMQELAQRHAATMLQIALAWLYAKQEVAAPVLRVKDTAELDEVAAAVKIKLNEEEIRYLEELYVPHRMP